MNSSAQRLFLPRLLWRRGLGRGRFSRYRVYGKPRSAFGTHAAYEAVASGRARHSVRAELRGKTKRRARSDAPYRDCSLAARTLQAFVLGCLVLPAVQIAIAAEDPLPSWNDTAPKKAIVA